MFINIKIRLNTSLIAVKFGDLQNCFIKITFLTMFINLFIRSMITLATHKIMFINVS